MPSTRLRHPARFEVGRTAVMETICYPADVVIEFLSYPIAFAGYFYFVLAMFEHNGQFNNYPVSHLMSYFSIAWLLRMIFAQGMDGEIGAAIRSGDIALALVRPMSLPDYYFSRFVGVGMARTIYYGIPAWLLLSVLFGDLIQIAASRIIIFLPYAMIAFRLAFEVQYLLGIISFYIFMNQQVSWSMDLLIRLASGLIVPLHLFPEQALHLLELLPFQYLYYKPIQALLEPGSTEALLSGILPGLFWLGAFYGLNRLLFILAMRRHVIYGS
jgi:ABC-2 type transport system permease protein